MTDRARRWADAPRNARLQRIARLERALEAAVMVMSCREMTPKGKEMVMGWNRLLKERPERPERQPEHGEAALF